MVHMRLLVGNCGAQHLRFVQEAGFEVRSWPIAKSNVSSFFSQCARHAHQDMLTGRLGSIRASRNETVNCMTLVKGCTSIFSNRTCSRPVPSW